MGQAAEHSTSLPVGIIMSKPPFNFVLRYSNIDITDYPKNAQDKGSNAFQQHLRTHLEHQYRSLDGNLNIEFSGDSVSVAWDLGQSAVQQKQQAIQLLQSGDINQAIPVLQTILKTQADDTDSLYNLGMIYSDQGNLEEAINLLMKATELDPKYNHAFVALGVAQLRNQQVDLAEASLTSALNLKSDDPYALRTLATLHMHKQDYISAISVLRHSLSLLPQDQASLFNLAKCLFKTGQAKNIDEAGTIASQLLNSNIGNEIAEKTQDLQREIAHHNFRLNSGKHENSDAVFYCIDALRRLKDSSQKEIAAVALEIAQLGQNGINIDNPKTTYAIKSFSGKFTGLALVCLLHVAIQKVSPGGDSGFDVQEEYKIAKGLFEKNRD